MTHDRNKNQILNTYHDVHDDVVTQDRDQRKICNQLSGSISIVRYHEFCFRFVQSSAKRDSFTILARAETS